MLGVSGCCAQRSRSTDAQHSQGSSPVTPSHGRGTHPSPSIRCMPSRPVMLGDLVGNDLPRVQTKGARGPWARGGDTPLQRHARCRRRVFRQEALRCLCHGWKCPDPPSGCLNGGEGVSLWVKLGSGLVFLPLLFPANGVLVMLAMPNAGKCGHVVLMPPLMYLPVCHPSPLSNERFCCQYAPSGPCGLRPMPPLMVGAANIMQTAHARAGIPY